jgi:hypothetical protein
MADHVTNELLLETLKAIPAKLSDMAGDLHDLKADMRGLKGHMAAFMQSEVAQDGPIASIQAKIVRAGGSVVELLKGELRTMDARLRFPVRQYLRDESLKAARELAAPYFARLKAGGDCAALWQEAEAAGHGHVERLDIKRPRPTGARAWSAIRCAL